MHRPSSTDPALSASDSLAGIVPVVRRIAVGETLFRQGDRTTGIYRLRCGRLRLLRMTAEGVAVPMHTVRAGELFAEASLFSPHYHCDAVALVDCEVLRYPKAALVQRMKVDPDAAWLFARELARHVQTLRTRLELRQVRSAPQRVLQALRLRCDDTGCWRVEGTLKQFAEEIGLTHEALYRALAALESSGSIARRDGAIRLT